MTEWTFSRYWTCDVCGAEFVSKRYWNLDAYNRPRTCSPACKQKAYRQRKAQALRNQPAKSVTPVTVADRHW